MKFPFLNTVWRGRLPLLDLGLATSLLLLGEFLSNTQTDSNVLEFIRCCYSGLYYVCDLQIYFLVTFFSASFAITSLRGFVTL